MKLRRDDLAFFVIFALVQIYFLFRIWQSTPLSARLEFP